MNITQLIAEATQSTHRTIAETTE